MAAHRPRRARKRLTWKRLREVLFYCPECGSFSWRFANGKHRAGGPAGHLNADGYIVINLDGRICRAHRLAWFYVHGRRPTQSIDHVNGNRSDNRIVNLRECSAAENNCNVARRRDNRSGVKGVNTENGGRSWVAKICVKGKRFRLGTFPSKELATAAYRRAATELHGKFARFE